MFDLIEFGAENAQLFNLLLMGTAGLIMTAPIFLHRSIPKRITVAMCLGLTAILMPFPAIDGSRSAGADNNLIQRNPSPGGSHIHRDGGVRQ